MQPAREEIRVRDEDGNPAVVVKITPFRRYDTLDGPNWVKGLASLYSDSGASVNALADGSYQEVLSGKRYWPT